MDKENSYAVGSQGKIVWARADEDIEIVSFIRELLAANTIDSATLQAIGAIKYAELITPNLESPKHEGREQIVSEPCEIMAIGNAVRENGGSHVIHLHCTLARQDTTGLAGHLIKAAALYFVEISISEKIGLGATRSVDPETTFKVLGFTGDDQA